MANQSITTDTNHDDLPGRASGEDITIGSGAILTIDSMPHLTSMGILGDIQLNDGEIHIDGTRTFDVTYSGGTGALPSVGASITWNAGSDTGKIIRFKSGDATSGVIVVTKQVGTITLDASDTVVSGVWTADVDSVAVGLLIVYGEDQIWDAVDARATVRVTGDWHEIYIGDGLDGQTITLPHNGWQWGVWVETGSGTGIYQKWCRINGVSSSIYYNSVADFGTDWESSGVFTQSGTTLTFGTSTAGGVIPSGAKVRIPNVHIGTTTTGAPTTEIQTTVLANYLEILDGSVSVNVFIDHLNASTSQLSLVQTNGATISDSCWGLHNATNLINKCNKPVTIANCVIGGGTALTGEPPLLRSVVIDNTGGITFHDCVFYGGTNASNGGALLLTTCANIAFTGTCKFIAGEQDENTFYGLRLTTSSNITGETLILLGGGLASSAGCSNISVDEFAYGQPPGRGATENTLNPINLSASFNVLISSGRRITNAAPMRGAQIVVTDCDGVVMRNFGAPNAKIDNGGFGSSAINIQGISTNCTFQRICFTNLASPSAGTMLNSAANIIFENCTSDYADEIDPQANNCIMKGHHGASGTVGAATGVEDDYINVIGSVFIDYFKSDTTGAVGLVFNDPGATYAAYYSIEAGTPIFNAIGDLLMRTSGDQVIYTCPYSVRAHNSFQNAAIQKIGNNVANIDVDYDLDTGSGFSGSWTTATGANLSGETISPTGFGIKIRLTATATNSSQDIRGLALLTNTTITDQMNNLYPLTTASATFSFFGLAVGTEVVLFDSSNTEVDREVIVGTTYSYAYTWNSNDGNQTGLYALIWKDDKQAIKFTGITLGNTSIDVPIAQQDDLVYDGTYTPQTTFDFASMEQDMATGVSSGGSVSVSIPQIYSEWKDEILLTNNAQYDFYYAILGGNTTSGTKTVPKYVFQINGSKLSLEQVNHSLSLIDGIIVQESGKPYVSPGVYTRDVQYEQPVQAITVSSGGITAPTATEFRGYIGMASANLDTQLSGIPAGVRTEIDTNSTKLDVAVSTRNATAPDNAGIAAIKVKTDNLPSDPADASVIDARFDAVDAAIAGIPVVTPPTAIEIRQEIDANSTKLDVAVSTRNAIAPDNAGIAAIKVATDNLPPDPVSQATLDADLLTLNTNILLGNSDTTDIKAKTDNLTFSGTSVQSDVTKVKTAPINGSGTQADPWGP